MQQTKWWAMALVLTCTFFTSVAQLLLKTGVMKISRTLPMNGPLLLGLLLYVIAAGLLLVALKFGELSVLYPGIATSFIWVNLLSLFILHEDIPPLRWVGIGLIIFGVSLIGLGSKTAIAMRTG
ncbi:hypothetical protein HY639_01150 [Candidatus Woesearchaeota archaeon]|nr:hypothetical protein [Candidatus Woesearchaeota archaeon]